MATQEPQIIGGRFVQYELIGRGGMASVYRGKDLQTEQIVAIKHLKSEIVDDNPDIIERFDREGEILRRLNHPGIVKVLATISENDNHYLIMEYVSGGSLSDLLKEQKRLPLERILQIGLDLADALTRAHRLNVIHRDIKPANVLLAPDGTPRLTDFGVAHIGDKSRLTETGSMIGTYAYLSPEGCRGEPLDERADIWSFGVMLYEMLAGRRPFEEPREAAILIAIMQKEVPELHEFRPDTPPLLIALVMSMLEKVPEDRINSVRQVGAELENVLRNLNVPADEQSEMIILKDLQVQYEGRFNTPTGSENEDQTITPHATTPAHQDNRQENPTVSIPPEKRSNTQQFSPVITGVILLLIILASGGALFGLINTGGDNSNDETPSSEEILIVNPQLAADQHLVLVADMESADPEIKETQTRLIIRNLQQNIEQENITLLSPLIVEHYPGVIQSEEQALAVAEANQATIIVWGNINQNGQINLEIQTGSLEKFPDIQMDRSLFDEIANIRIRIQDTNQASFAQHILGAFHVMQYADGDVYGGLKTLVIGQYLSEQSTYNPVVVTGGTPASMNFHEMFAAFFTDIDAALEAAGRARQAAPDNPLVIIYQAGLYARQDNIQEGYIALNATQGLLNRYDWGQDWVTMDYSRAFAAYYEGNYLLAAEYFTAVIEKQPDEWFNWNFRAALYYLLKEYDNARADYEKALSLGPDAIFPYPFLTMLAFREADLVQAQEYARLALEKFNNPDYSQRIAGVLIQREDGDIFGAGISAFSNLIFFNYQEAINAAEAALNINPELVDMYIVLGISRCNRNDYAAAEEALSAGIELEPEFTTLYLLRAMVYIDPDNPAQDTAKAMDDIQTARDLSEMDSEQFAPYVTAVLQGDLTCKNAMFYNPTRNQ